MKKFKNSFKSICGILAGFLLTLLVYAVGASSGVFLAEASAMPDAGKTNAGDPGGTGGISTESENRQEGDPEFYSKDIDA